SMDRSPLRLDVTTNLRCGPRLGLVRSGTDRLPRRLRGNTYAHRRNETLDLRARTLDLAALLLQMVAQVAGRHPGNGLVEALQDTVFAPQRLGCVRQFDVRTDTYQPIPLQRAQRTPQTAATFRVAAGRRHALGKVIGDPLMGLRGPLQQEFEVGACRLGHQ